jgi:6-phosphofructokinase 1
MSKSEKNALGIVVSGGPAPGINGVIAAATIEARNRGIPVLGIHDGFRWISEGNCDAIRPLDIPDVSRIHLRGGSILRTSRVNPTKREETLANVVRSLKSVGIRWFVSIGGDDTAFAATRIAEMATGSIQVVHVPKTIDNDLPLPGGIQTFGFETARHEGVSIVGRIMEDARSTARWYFLVAMGRKAGHLALGIGKAAGATLSLIPEEFGDERLRIAQIADVIEGSIIKRRAMGREHGVVVLAEGLGERLDPADLLGIDSSERDDYGNIRLSEVPLGDLLKTEVRSRFAERGIDVKIISKDVGYEIRCADPIPFDAEYTRDLGYGAAYYAFEGGTNAMITRLAGKIVPMAFDELLDPDTGRTRVRMVNTDSEAFKIARTFMIRMTPEDLKDAEWAERLAKAGATTVADLQARFG